MNISRNVTSKAVPCFWPLWTLQFMVSCDIIHKCLLIGRQGTREIEVFCSSIYPVAEVLNVQKYKAKSMVSVQDTMINTHYTKSQLSLSYGNRTTTNPHNPLYVLYRWYWMPQSHTWQPLSICCQHSVSGRPESSLYQELKNPSWVVASI